MLSYAGIPLTQLSPFLREKCERWWAENAPDLWSFPGYQTSGLYHLPVPPEPVSEKARLNTLIWPTGASRWGVFHAVCDYASTAQIQAIVGQVAPSRANLIIKDDTAGTGLEVGMHLLAIRPLFSAGEDNNKRLLWLTFVDPRYFWWQRDLEFTITDGSSWSTLLTNLVSAATGLTPTIPSIPVGYGTPNYSRWNQQGCPLPLLIDAAAATVGLRFLYKLDGTCEFQTASAAATADASRWSANSAECSLGGRMVATDLAGNTPEYVSVGAWPQTPTDTLEITDVTLASLALPEYGAITGVTNAKAWIMGDRYSGQSSPTASAYATQAATDYYRWALTRTEATFRSIRPLNPNGFDDRVEWEYAPPLPPENLGRERENIPTLRNKRLLTRIVPTAFGDRNIYGSAPDSSEQCCGEGADWYDTDGHIDNFSTSAQSNNSATNIVVRQTFTKIPANTGDVWIDAGILSSVSLSSGIIGGANWILSVFAFIAEVDSNANYIGPVTGDLSAVVAAENDTATLPNYPKGRQGDFIGGQALIGTNNTYWAKTTQTKKKLTIGASDRYFAWALKWIFTAKTSGGSLLALTLGIEVFGIGNGQTWLTWDKICCLEPAVVPPAQPPLTPVFGMDMQSQAAQFVVNNAFHIQGVFATASGPNTDPGGA